MDKKELEIQFENIRDILEQTKGHYNTDNGLAYREGMEFVYNLFVNRILKEEEFLI